VPSLDGLRQEVIDARARAQSAAVSGAPTATVLASKADKAETDLADIEILIGQVRPLDEELAVVNAAKEVVFTQLQAAREVAREVTSRRDPVARDLNEKITELGAFLGLGPQRLGA